MVGRLGDGSGMLKCGEVVVVGWTGEAVERRGVEGARCSTVVVSCKRTRAREVERRGCEVS